MPQSNDNQDFGQADIKNKQEGNLVPQTDGKLSSDNFKGKKVDGDPSREADQPADVSEVSQ